MPSSPHQQPASSKKQQTSRPSASRRSAAVVSPDSAAVSSSSQREPGREPKRGNSSDRGGFSAGGVYLSVEAIERLLALSALRNNALPLSTPQGGERENAAAFREFLSKEFKVTERLDEALFEWELEAVFQRAFPLYVSKLQRIVRIILDIGEMQRGTRSYRDAKAVEDKLSLEEVQQFYAVLMRFNSHEATGQEVSLRLANIVYYSTYQCLSQVCLAANRKGLDARERQQRLQENADALNKTITQFCGQAHHSVEHGLEAATRKMGLRSLLKRKRPDMELLLMDDLPE